MPSRPDDASGAGAPSDRAGFGDIRTWLVATLAAHLDVARNDIDTTAPLSGWGMASRDAVALSERLGAWLGRPVAPTIFWDQPTVDRLAAHLAADATAPPPAVDEEGGSAHEPIAVVGIGCRFPGAAGPAAFWRLLTDGRDAITTVPPDRFAADDFYDPDPATPGTIVTRWGGFLQDIDRFDAGFFGISPREASRMDPQQRLMLEIAWEALEDAGQPVDALAGSKTGVFVGISTNDYGRRQFSDPTLIDSYAGTGNALSIAANRISFQFDLRGPSVAVDTACSSSLVAVHMACRSLWNGEATLALAGGVNLILAPDITINFTKAGVMAPDGRCKAFDARANGYVRGEGAALVVLKPLSRARADHDRIYAVILGSAVNNDGRTNGLMAPSRQAQEAVLRDAYACARISPGLVQYVEAHGTGTLLGDPIELTALGAVLATERAPSDSCAVGSVKTNIGHLEAAAGVAGLVKVALALKHGAIPKSLHFETPNPHIPFTDLPVRVQQTLGDWASGRHSRIAGVSSFGFGGTNAHVVLGEAPPHGADVDEIPFGRDGRCVLPVSARSPEALAAAMRAACDFLASTGAAGTPLPDICYAASLRRSHHRYRVAVTGRTTGEMVEQVTARLADDSFARDRANGSDATRRGVVFVFPGQGAQWIGMGRQLLEQEVVFRAALEDCDRALRKYLDWSLLEVIAGFEPSHLDDVDVVQPLLFGIQVALAAVWRSWGIEPSMVVGHSMGEVAAACVAGALTLEDSARVICERSQLLKTVSGRGGMAVVDLPIAAAAHAAAAYREQVAIAVESSPQSTVLSGDVQALETLVSALEQEDVFCRLVKVDVASHSPQVDPLLVELRRRLAHLQPRLATVPLCSTVTGTASNGIEFDGEYWTRNLRAPVLFSTVIQRLLADGHATFLEISPHPILLGAIQQGAQSAGRAVTVLPSLRRDEDERAAMLDSLCGLYTLGHDIAWNRLVPRGRDVALPPYPWQRERCWFDIDMRAPAPGTRRSRSDRSHRPRHPLLDRYFRRADEPTTHYWETEVSTRSHPFLADHRIDEQPLFPAAAYIEMAFAAATELLGWPCALTGVELTQALFLQDADVPATVQLVLSEDAGGAAFRIYSRPPDVRADWTLHATGMARRVDGTTSGPASPIDVAATRAACGEEIDGERYYTALQSQGLQYGPRHRGIERVWRGRREAIGQVRVPSLLEPELGLYRLHPAVLDAALQVVGAAGGWQPGRDRSSERFLPVRIGEIRMFDRPAPPRWSIAWGRDTGAQEDLTADVQVVDDGGHLVVDVRALALRRVGGEVPRTPGIDDWFYERLWEPQALGATKSPGRTDHGRWIVFADRAGVAERLARRIEAQGDTAVLVRPGAACLATSANAWEIDPASPDDARQLLASVLGREHPHCHGVVHLWNLDTEAADPDLSALESARLLGCASVLHLVQALVDLGMPQPPRLFLLTRGAQSASAADPPVSVTQAPVWGLARTTALEHPELRTICIDLGGAGADELRALHEEITAATDEDQIALRDGQRYVARLARVPGDLIAPAATYPFRLEVANAGVIDRLMVRTRPRRPPAAGEVEIEVEAAGLNFMDVMRTLGLVPPPKDGPLSTQSAPAPTMAAQSAPAPSIWLGAECAGRVAAIGAGVSHVRPGDQVVAVAQGTFGHFVTTASALVAARPAGLSSEEAATIPVAFLTAFYALRHVARLRPGERVLVHAAAGGVGLAAVQIARARGAEIFATAGSPAKREYLRSLGIDHVFDSRSAAFADGVMAATHGEGVDVVLNSLSGDLAARSLSLLRPAGRFLEIGKRDIHENRPLHLAPFRRTLAYFAIDLQQICADHPALAGAMLRRLMRGFAAGTLRPLPFQTFAMSAATDALRFMAQAKHTGKIVLTVPACDPAQPGGLLSSVRPDATYLITGGLGGLGLAVAQWMTAQGARHLVLTGRRAPSAAAEDAILSMRRAGADVRVVQADVADRDRMAGLLDAIEAPATSADGAREDGAMPPLRGVIHAAGVLDDGVIAQLDRGRLAAVARPKVEGAWNLHLLTRRHALDFFVLFSSASAVLGSPGQANYAAANAFLDALALHRRARGLPALAIDWGPWGDIGLAARRGRADRLALRGVGTIGREDGLEAFGRLLRSRTPAHISVMPIEVDRLDSRATTLPVLARLVPRRAHTGVPDAHRTTTRDAVMRAAAGERPRLLQAVIREQLAQVLWLSPATIDAHRPLNTLGVDSLMAIEFRNRVERELGVRLPIAILLQGPDLVQLAEHLARQFSGEVPEEGAALAPGDALPSIAPDSASRHLPFPLNDIQGAYWVGRSPSLELGNVGSHFYLEFERSDLDVDRLAAAWQQLIARHEMLRAIVRPDGQQQILPTVPQYELAVADLRGESENDARAAALAVRERMAHQVYDPARWPMFEIRATHLPDERTRVHVSIDLLIADVWSLFLLFREWGARYADPATKLTPLALSFRDYVLAEAALESTARYERARAYWTARLPDLAPGPALPLACAPTSIARPRFIRRSGGLDGDAWQRIRQRARQHGLTPSMVLCTAFAEVLAAWSRESRFTLNLTLFHRQPLHADVTAIVGDFTSTVLLAVDGSAGTDFVARARPVQEQLSADLEHGEVSGVRVLRDLARQAGGGPRATMPVVFTSTLGQEGGGALAPTAWLGDLVFGISQTPQVWLDHQVGEDGDGLVFNWDAVEALFPAGLLDAMFGAYCTRLAALAADAAAWVATAPALIPDDQVRARDTMNATAAPMPEVTLPELVAAQMTQRPSAPSVITPTRTLTYAEANVEAGAVADWLRAHGAEPNHPVAVVMEKGWEQVAAVLGVVRAGAAYLPIDADVPAERLARLLAQGEASLVLTQSWLVDRLTWPPGLTIAAVDGLGPTTIADGDALESAPRPDDLAYVIFTSGSTGVPKGVMLTHRAVVNTLLDLNARWGVGPSDRVLSLSALSFDLSVYDIFGTLAAGGAVVLPADDARRDPGHWLARAAEDRVTVWNTVPALMQLLVEAAEAAGTGLPASLRLVLMSGDWIPVSLPARIRALAPSAQIVSLGGATEAAIWSIHYPIDAIDPAWASIPYGRPLANQTWHVLHADWTPCPVWVAGELYIGGAGLAQGYWRDPERTRERFVVHPVTGQRLYRTGDWGRCLPDGTIEFLGRDDLQVKVQGYRIELGEIEATLLRQPGVAHAVVSVHGERMGDKRLVAFVVGRDETTIEPAALRAALQAALPSYMVPGRLEVLAEVPLTANGKVDRQALTVRASDPHHAANAVSQDAGALDGIGARIEGLIASVLKVERVDPHADFFALGLTSIDMMRLANSLEQTFGFRPQMADLFTLTDLAALTSYYEDRIGHAAPATRPTADRLLLDPDERESFKRQHPGERAFSGPSRSVRLARSTAAGADALGRRSHRRYGTDPLALGDLAALLECLAEAGGDSQPRRRYGSAGGLYPVQTYLHVRPRRVDDLAAGTYYYHPREHGLIPLTPEVDLDGALHVVINRPVFEQASFSIFLVGQLNAIAPVYGERARDFALIEAGLIAQLLETEADAHRIGLCQIGLVDFEAIRDLFRLEADHVFLHALLGGPMASDTEVWEEGTL